MEILLDIVFPIIAGWFVAEKVGDWLVYGRHNRRAKKFLKEKTELLVNGRVWVVHSMNNLSNSCYVHIKGQVDLGMVAPYWWLLLQEIQPANEVSA